jgi:hypothetical protein
MLAGQEPLADYDLTDARTYLPARHDPTAGRWHLLPSGDIVHETADGNLQRSIHTAEALADPARFTLA